MRELHQSIASAVIVEVTADDGVVRFGACVRVRSTADGEVAEYRIVGPAEADAGRGRISSISPLAKALLNRKVGDRVLFQYPAGEDTLEILSVSY
jgi:transcription elongation GreA/GreB family factor